MDKIRITRRCYPDRYWLTYVNNKGAVKQVSLTSCANSFGLHTNNIYNIGDNIQPVGWRYEVNGYLYYELFCVGHVQLYYPAKPGLLDRIRYLLQGKNPQDAHRLKLASFEQALNSGGWKTVEKPDSV